MSQTVSYCCFHFEMALSRHKPKAETSPSKHERFPVGAHGAERAERSEASEASFVQVQTPQPSSKITREFPPSFTNNMHTPQPSSKLTSDVLRPPLPPFYNVESENAKHTEEKKMKHSPPHPPTLYLGGGMKQPSEVKY